MSRPRAYQLAFGVFLLSVVGMAYNLENHVLFLLCWAFALAFSFLSFHLRQVPCPHGGKMIHQYWQRFVYCPYCGKSLKKDR